MVKNTNKIIWTIILILALGWILTAGIGRTYSGQSFATEEQCQNNLDDVKGNYEYCTECKSCAGWEGRYKYACDVKEDTTRIKNFNEACKTETSTGPGISTPELEKKDDAFEVRILSIPEEVTQGSSFSFTTNVRNTRGEPGVMKVECGMYPQSLLKNVWGVNPILQAQSIISIARTTPNCYDEDFVQTKVVTLAANDNLDVPFTITALNTDENYKYSIHCAAFERCYTKTNTNTGQSSHTTKAIDLTGTKKDNLPYDWEDIEAGEQPTVTPMFNLTETFIARLDAILDLRKTDPAVFFGVIGVFILLIILWATQDAKKPQ